MVSLSKMGGPNILDASAQNEVLTFTFPLLFALRSPFSLAVTVEGAAIKGPKLTGLYASTMPLSAYNLTTCLNKSLWQINPKKKLRRSGGK